MMADIATNETLVQANLVSINAAQATFYSANGRYGTIRELVDDGLLIVDYASKRLNGYILRENIQGGTYWVNADPHEPGVTGNQCFFVNESGLLHAETDRSANARSPLV